MRLPDEYRQGLHWWFRAFSKMQFPKLPFSDGEAAGLRGELISYDAYIAGYISRLINGQDVDANKLYLNKDLRWRFEGLGRRRPELWPFVYSCLDYLDIVHGIIETIKGSAQVSRL